MAVATASAGAATLATAAGACCVPVVAPLIVAVLGASGAAWAAGLEPYSLAILVLAGMFLGYSYWVLYRLRTAAAGEACAVRRTIAPRVVLWIATAFWTLAALLNVFPQALSTFQ